MLNQKNLYQQEKCRGIIITSKSRVSKLGVEYSEYQSQISDLQISNIYNGYTNFSYIAVLQIVLFWKKRKIITSF